MIDWENGAIHSRYGVPFNADIDNQSLPINGLMFARVALPNGELSREPSADLIVIRQRQSNGDGRLIGIELIAVRADHHNWRSQGSGFERIVLEEDLNTSLDVFVETSAWKIDFDSGSCGIS